MDKMSSRYGKEVIGIFNHNENDSMSNLVFEGCLKMFHIIPYSYLADNFVGLFSSHDLVDSGIVVIDDVDDEDGTPSLRSIPLTSFQKNTLINFFGVQSIHWKKTFHKSWDKVANAPLSQLIMEQIAHYFSTYGLESMGYEAHPYLPTEDVFKDFEDKVLPNLSAFTVIHVVSDHKARQIIFDYLYNVTAPNKNYINYITKYCRTLLGQYNIDNIKSFEVKCIAYDLAEMVPQNGQDFMRYVVYLVTGKPLLIKDKATIEALRTITTHPYLPLLQKISMIKLAEVFYRYKPLFLAMRSQKECRPYINKIRKLADTFHKPMSNVNIQNLTVLANAERFNDIDKILKQATFRQLIKVCNYFSTMIIHTPDSSVYNIRNGKLYVKNSPMDKSNENIKKYFHVYDSIQSEINKRCNGKYDGKSFFIPDKISYPVPVSEKQFIGNIPWGTNISLSEDKSVVSAIYWENLKETVNDWDGCRVDLDLHLQSIGEAFGWNAQYRGREGNILYSGDMTDATKGAVEAFYFTPAKADKKAFLLTVSNFTRQKDIRFKVFFTDEYDDVNVYGDNCCTSNGVMIDISKAVAPPIEFKFDDDGRNSMNIGLFHEGHFYFYGGSLSKSIVPRHGMYDDFIRAMVPRISTMFNLKAFLLRSGATVYSESSMKHLTDEEKNAIMSTVIDLSPSALTANTLTELVDYVDKKQVNPDDILA